MPSKSRPWLAALRLTALISATLLLYGLYRLCALGRRPETRLPLAARWDNRWGRAIRRIIGVRLTQSGPLPPPGALLIPNHMGYLDIVALQSLLPCFFVPKADIASWPVAGPLIRACGHIYIERARKRSLVDAAAQMSERLKLGLRVVVFLEGTSTGGDRLLPFKPSLLQPALETHAPLVPVGLHWSVDARRNGGAVDIVDEVAYWRDSHVIGPHFWHVLGLRGVAVHVRFGVPLLPDAEAASDRKQLAGMLHQQVDALRQAAEK